MVLVSWLCRCIPGFTILAWTLIAFLALGARLPLWTTSTHDGGKTHDTSRHYTVSLLLYICFSVFIHLLACLGYPLRLGWALWHVTDKVKLAKAEAAVEENHAAQSKEFHEAETSSTFSLSTNDASPQGSISRTSTPQGLRFSHASNTVIHAIILPSYKEDIDTLRETLAVLASHKLAQSSYDVYLAMEQRDSDSETTATTLITIFSTSFHTITYTLHPGDILGEVAGKSSNVSWAARQLSHNYADDDSRRSCVITVMDSDTHLKSGYFLLLSKFHRQNQPDSASTMYVTPIIFDRNAHQVNPLVRAADILWCGAGLSGLYEGSPIMIPTSVYSVAMTLAGQVGGWDTGPESIGEDLHMFLKCHFATSGRFHTKIIYSPASQSNVSSDMKGWRGATTNLHARYRQALRHMWGALDTGYAVERTMKLMRGRKNDESNSDWLSSTDNLAERVPQWVNSSNLKHFTPPNLYEPLPTTRSPVSPSPFHFVILFHRLYEAHFLPTHLTVALVSSLIYTTYIPSVITPPLLLTSFNINGYLRAIGFLLMSFNLYLYDLYHRLCVRAREDEMKQAGLWEAMHENGGFSHRTWRKNWIDYCLLPVTGTIFGTIPAMVAEGSHFLTNRLVYTVSGKPMVRWREEIDRKGP